MKTLRSMDTRLFSTALLLAASIRLAAAQTDSCTCIGHREICEEGNDPSDGVCADCEDVDLSCLTRCPCEDGCRCTNRASLVCGADGNTYGNPCYARCAGTEVACAGMCPCNCTANIARCTNPCRRALCPAYPEAQCYASRCGQCEALFIWNGTAVDCDASSGEFSLFSDSSRRAEPSAPSPSELADCRRESERCNAFLDAFSDSWGQDAPCCPGYACCIPCSASQGSSLLITSGDGTCEEFCPPCE